MDSVRTLVLLLAVNVLLLNGWAPVLASFPVDPRQCPTDFPEVLPCSQSGSHCSSQGACPPMTRDVVRLKKNKKPASADLTLCT